MRPRLFGLVLLAAAVSPAFARGAPVQHVGARGRVVLEQDRFLPDLDVAPLPAAPAVAEARKTRRPRGRVAAVLGREVRTRRLSPAARRRFLAVWDHAQGRAGRLHGVRAAELRAVIDNVARMAVGGQLTPGRLPVLALTLARNAQYWPSAPLPRSGQRVEFAGSQLVWQYYPGQGLELQVLGTFGRADGLFSAGPSHYAALRKLLGEMIPLAVQRAGGLAWEYYFSFDGGRPPWTSAMSQGTAIEALTDGYLSLAAVPAPAAPDYLQIARRALGLFRHRPPVGVAVRTRRGRRYVQYSFAPARGQEVINAFLQALIGLHKYASVSHDPAGAALFAAGNREAKAELPHFDTGSWSLYQPGQPDSLSYHRLVTGFVETLCGETQARVYCRTARHFRAYLRSHRG